MTWGIVASVGSTLVGSYLSSNAQEDAAQTAADAQSAASDKSIAESRRQFNSIQELLKPYSTAGVSAITGQQNLLGLNGRGPQALDIANIANGPQMQALQQQGENSILQNASATGGLRGGNVQGALAQFRPQLLQQLIQQQYGNLGGLVGVGQNAAAGVGNAGQNSSNQVINALQQTGAAQAGSALASGQAQANAFQGVANVGSTLGTLQLLGKFPNSQPTAMPQNYGGIF